MLVWNVSRLIQLATELPVVRWPVSAITEMDEAYWYDLGNAVPTCRHIVDHMTLVMQAELTYPIILDNTGRVMDGMHRVCRAVYDGQTEVLAKQFPEPVTPDYRDVAMGDLPDPQVYSEHC